MTSEREGEVMKIRTENETSFFWSGWTDVDDGTGHRQALDLDSNLDFSTIIIIIIIQRLPDNNGSAA